MEGMLGTEHQNIPYLPSTRTGVRISRRTRWHRGQFVAHRDIHPKNVINEGLGGIQIVISIPSRSERRLNKLEQLKALKFTAVGRQERIARSLAVLEQPGAIQLSQDDWNWLDANAAIEDEFE